jgi:hypothetical protein
MLLHQNLSVSFHSLQTVRISYVTLVLSTTALIGVLADFSMIGVVVLGFLLIVCCFIALFFLH